MMVKEDAAIARIGRAETKQKLGKSPGSSRGVNLEDSWGDRKSVV